MPRLGSNGFGDAILYNNFETLFDEPQASTYEFRITSLQYHNNINDAFSLPVEHNIIGKVPYKNKERS